MHVFRNSNTENDICHTHFNPLRINSIRFGVMSMRLLAFSTHSTLNHINRLNSNRNGKFAGNAIYEACNLPSTFLHHNFCLLVDEDDDEALINILVLEN